MAKTETANDVSDLFSKSSKNDVDLKMGSKEIHLPESINETDLHQITERVDPEKSHDPEYDLFKDTPIYIRHQFIRKVFLIVVLQLLFTLAVTALVYFVPVIRDFLTRHPYISVGSATVYCVMTIVFIIFPKLLENRTVCICFLSAETTLLTLVVATVTCFYELKEISIALGVTVLVFSVLTVASFQIKYDLTRWFGFTIILSLIILSFGILVIVLPFKPLYLAFTILSTIVTCIYILVDVQLICGGKKKYQFSVDDYMLAASTLYCDFISLFIDMLRFFRF